MAPPNSVIVCTYNRAGRLERALLALARQRPVPGGFETVVVDDGSTDETPQVCERMAEQMPGLRYVANPRNRGLCNARNLGVASARGERLMYLDDDCIPRPDWVLRMTESLRREPIVAGAVATSSDGFLQLCHNVAQFYGSMPCQRPRSLVLISGANMGFRRSVLEQLGKFNERLRYAEDTEMSLRAYMRGYRPYFNHRAVVTHDPGRSTLHEIFRYARAHASTTVHLRSTYRKLLRTPFVLRSPWLLVGASPAIALVVTLRIYLGSPHLLQRFWTAPIVYALKVAWCLGAAHGLRHPPEPRTATP